MDLRSFLSNIDWSRVQRITTTQNGDAYSFAVEVSKHKRLITICVDPGRTTLTVSDLKGRILEHVVQQGPEMVYYEPKPGQEPMLGASLDALAPIHIVSTDSEPELPERGI